MFKGPFQPPPQCCPQHPDPPHAQHGLSPPGRAAPAPRAPCSLYSLTPAFPFLEAAAVSLLQILSPIPSPCPSPDESCCLPLPTPMSLSPSSLSPGQQQQAGPGCREASMMLDGVDAVNILAAKAAVGSAVTGQQVQALAFAAASVQAQRAFPTADPPGFGLSSFFGGVIGDANQCRYEHQYGCLKSSSKALIGMFYCPRNVGLLPHCCGVPR